MLANSFSYLPVRHLARNDERCYLISDVAVAAYLSGAESTGARNRRLQTRVQDAVYSGHLKVDTPVCVKATCRLSDLIPELTSIPVLVVGDSPDELIGIVTAFDLL